MTALARLFGLLPWDIDRLTISEFDVFAHEVDEEIKAQKSAQRRPR